MLLALLSLNTESLISYGGIMLLSLLVFCSVGLFFCFFLPVGGILFAAGIIAAKGDLLPSIATTCLLLSLSSSAGSLAGYGIGRSTGKFIYSRKDSGLFRRSYLVATEEFYKKYGSWAMIAGYFLPIIRNCAPLLAGVVKLKFQRFFVFNAIGSVAFVSVFLLTGYLIGSLPFLQPWLKYIVAFFILAVSIPMIFKVISVIRKPADRPVEK